MLWTGQARGRCDEPACPDTTGANLQRRHTRSDVTHDVYTEYRQKPRNKQRLGHTTPSSAEQAGRSIPLPATGNKTDVMTNRALLVTAKRTTLTTTNR